MTYRTGNDKTALNYVVAQMISLGILTEGRITAAMELVKQAKEFEKIAREKAAVEEAEKRRVQNTIDQKFPNLYNRRNVEPEAYSKYMASVSIEELKWFFDELKSRPFHWNSLFSERDISDATSALADELTKRTNANTEKPLHNVLSKMKELKQDINKIQTDVHAAIHGKKCEQNYAT